MGEAARTSWLLGGGVDGHERKALVLGRRKASAAAKRRKAAGNEAECGEKQHGRPLHVRTGRWTIAPTPKISTGIAERQDQHRRDQPAAPERHRHRGADGAEGDQRRGAAAAATGRSRSQSAMIHASSTASSGRGDEQRQRGQQPVRDHFCGNDRLERRCRRGGRAAASRPRHRRGTAGRARAASTRNAAIQTMPGARRASSTRSGPMAKGTIDADHDEEQHQGQRVAAGAEGEPRSRRMRARKALMRRAPAPSVRMCGAASASARSWCVAATAMPPRVADARRSAPRPAPRPRASSAAVGSSSSQIGRVGTSSRASASRRVWPAERCPASSAARRRGRPRRARRRCAIPVAAVDGGPERRGFRRRVSRGLTPGGGQGGGCPSPGRVSASRPVSAIVPGVRPQRPGQASSRLVLPTPFGPRSSSTSPGRTARSSPSNSSVRRASRSGRVT